MDTMDTMDEEDVGEPGPTGGGKLDEDLEEDLEEAELWRLVGATEWWALWGRAGCAGSCSGREAVGGEDSRHPP